MKTTLFHLPANDLAHVFALARAELEALRGARLFLTGGTGFFGKWLVGALVEADQELGLGLNLTVLSRDPAAFVATHPEVCELPQLNWLAGPVAELEPGHCRYDFVIHAATDTTAVTSPEQEVARTHTVVDGTRRVLALARASGARRVLAISSGAVYGTATGKRSGAVEEDYDSATPQMPYAEAKRAAEQLCVESGLGLVTARAFAFLGPHLPLEAHFAAGNFLRDALRGGPIQVRGDGTALRSYLYPADLVIWLLRLLLRGQVGRAYNVGSDEVVSTAELARTIAGRTTPPAEVVIQSQQPQGPQNIYLPNITRARRELGLDVSIPLAEAIERTLQFWRDLKKEC